MLADFDHDGHLDLVISATYAGRPTDFYWGLGNGRFVLDNARSGITTTDGWGIAIADVDQDGDLDGATCSKEKQRTSLYLNDGKGCFTRLDIDTGQSSYDLRAVDMDGDGDLDLLNAGMTSRNIVWYENPLK